MTASPGVAADRSSAVSTSGRHRGVETVGAQQVPVAVLGFPRQQIRFDRFAVQGSDQRGRDRGPLDVVLGQLEQLTRAQHVRPRIAHVHHAESGARPEQRGERGARVRQAAHGRARRAKGFPERVERIPGARGVQRFERVDRGDARLLPAGAETVGDGQQVRSRVGGVLVRLAHEATVGAGGVDHPGHRSVLSGQLLDEEGDEPPACREIGFGLVPVGEDLRGRIGPRQHALDPRQRHPGPPEPSDQPPALNLVR